MDKPLIRYLVVGPTGIGLRLFFSIAEAEQHATPNATSISKITIQNGEIISTQTVKRIR